ncbi:MULTISPECIES: TrkH family potassium uptake protein [unclassified Gemella]|uniref:TrkH family potassium uptake protein n=1 Tax=unclassified Gemella TaxID=2624949 RepID=UPI001D168999|nr:MULTISPECIES: potassium transporter TrkG [unclassified Gemella]
MLLLSFFLLFPSICAFIYNEPKKNITSFLYTILISLVISLIFQILANPKTMKKNFYAKEGFVIVAITWLIYSFLGSLPFYFSGSIENFLDSIFESTSGFTATGSSILTNIEIMPHSMLFWRSLTHFIGGMGVIIFAIVLLPRSPHNIHIMKAEMPGPIFGKLMSSMKNTAIGLYSLYIILTILLFFLLVISGIGVFDSINLALSTAGTGGFAPKNLGIAAYSNDYITFVIAIFMILFALNLNLVYMIIVKRYFKAFKSEELRWFLSFIILSTFAIFIHSLISINFESERLLDVFFTVSSIISTTGFTYRNFSDWSMFSQLLILFLMIIGGCAGGTAGGLKIPRIMFLFKNTQNYIHKCINPNKITTITIEKKTLENQDIFSNYLILYLMTFSTLVLLISTQLDDFEKVFTLVMSTLNNIGPGFNSYGPFENYADIPYLGKLFLTISMLLGRLEIIPFIVLLAPQTWRRKRTK